MIKTRKELLHAFATGTPRKDILAELLEVPELYFRILKGRTDPARTYRRLYDIEKTCCGEKITRNIDVVFSNLRAGAEMFCGCKESIARQKDKMRSAPSDYKPRKRRKMINPDGRLLDHMPVARRKLSRAMRTGG